MTILYQFYQLFYSLNVVVELIDVTECTECDPGKYCDSLGMTSVAGKCDPGFLCFGNATTSNPNDNITGSICPVGGYCPAGEHTNWFITCIYQLAF